MPFLVNPVTGTVVSVQGDLEARYRARGWAELGAQPKESLAPPEEPGTEADDKPVARRNARRTTR